VLSILSVVIFVGGYSDVDYNFSVRVPFFQLAKRRLRLAHFVSAIDDRHDFSGLHQVAQDIQIIFWSVSQCS